MAKIRQIWSHWSLLLIWWERYKANLGREDKRRYLHLIIFSPISWVRDVPRHEWIQIDNKYEWIAVSLFHKAFFFVIYGKMAVNYVIFAIYEQIYGQYLAVTTNP